MPLITDWTDPNFDSYATLDEIKQLILWQNGVQDITKWLETDEESKENLIRFSTRELAVVTFTGTAVDTITGPLALWPREGVVAPNGYEVPSDDIPTFVKRWQAMRQLELLDESPIRLVQGGEVLRERLEGVGEVEYARGSARRGKAPLSAAPSWSEIGWAADLRASSSPYIAVLERY